MGRCKEQIFQPVRCGKCDLLLLKGAPIGSLVYCPKCCKWTEARPELAQDQLKEVKPC